MLSKRCDPQSLDSEVPATQDMFTEPIRCPSFWLVDASAPFPLFELDTLGGSAVGKQHDKPHSWWSGWIRYPFHSLVVSWQPLPPRCFHLHPWFSAHGGFLKRGEPLNNSFLYVLFHYKPSFLGVPLFLEPPTLDLTENGAYPHF